MDDFEKQQFREELDNWFIYLRKEKREKELSIRINTNQLPKKGMTMEEYINEEYKQKIIKQNNNDILICPCNSLEHHIVFQHNIEDNIVYCRIHLSQHGYNIFKRIWYAIRYIFGYKSKWGDYEDIIIDNKNKFIFHEMVNRIRDNDSVEVNDSNKPNYIH